MWWRNGSLWAHRLVHLHLLCIWSSQLPGSPFVFGLWHQALLQQAKPPIISLHTAFGHVTLPTYWWSFPVYSSSRKNWFHIHPRLERWRILPSLSGIPNSFPIFPGMNGRAVLGHSIESVRRSRTWLVIMVSNQMANVLDDFWIMVISFWLDEHWKAVSSEQTLYSCLWSPSDPCEKSKVEWGNISRTLLLQKALNPGRVEEPLRQHSECKRTELISAACISLSISALPSQQLIIQSAVRDSFCVHCVSAEGFQVFEFTVRTCKIKCLELLNSVLFCHRVKSCPDNNQGFK